MIFFQKKLLISLLLISISLLVACKNGDDPSPDTSFIEFTIDGQTYRINSTNSTLEGSHSGQYLVSPPSHILTMVFASQTNPDMANVTLLLNQTDSLKKKVYPNLSVGGGASFIALFPDLNGYSLDPLTGNGTIELTAFESESGGAVRGTFSFTALNLIDENQQILSSGHTLSDGSFQILMD